MSSLSGPVSVASLVLEVLCFVACFSLSLFGIFVKHSFSGIFTASTGTSNLPEVVAVALVNNIEASYCDSKIEKAIPKQDWMENLRDGEPEYWKEYAQDCAVNRLFFEEQFHILKRRLNQTTSVHILQKVIGCEWDDETETSHGYQHYGFDGEDFLVFDLKTLTWIATKPQAVITKHYWDRQKTTNDLWKYYLTQVCVDWLKKHLKYGRISLMRTDLPSVSLLQKTPSSQVTCHATGFYPDRADLFWRKDGEELHEDVDKGEILPNHDGTFQMSVDLKISSITPEDWKKYDCVFQLSGVKDDIITKLDKSVIRTNQSKTEMEIKTCTILQLFGNSCFIFYLLIDAGWDCLCHVSLLAHDQMANTID
uniref:Ig-like domain-containing protein n=1 Tax=Amphiprion ocellaris TaxID=80972 RepID=A0A3Q1CNE3_AMPOC